MKVERTSRMKRNIGGRIVAEMVNLEMQGQHLKLYDEANLLYLSESEIEELCQWLTDQAIEKSAAAGIGLTSTTRHDRCR